MQAHTHAHTSCFRIHCLRDQKWHLALHFPVSTFTEKHKKINCQKLNEQIQAIRVIIQYQKSNIKKKRNGY